MIEVVNRRTAPPVREGELRFAIGRASSGTVPGEIPLHALGNPFKLGAASREEVVARYQQYLLERIAAKDEEVCRALNLIYRAAKAGREVSLSCFCAPQACHAQVVAALVEEKLAPRK